MATKGSRNKQVVWQDIKPVKKTLQPVPKKVEGIKKILTTHLSLARLPVYIKTKDKIRSIPKTRNIFTRITSLKRRIVLCFKSKTKKLKISKRRFTAGLILLFICILLVGGYTLFAPHPAEVVNVNKQPVKKEPGLIPGKPEYAVLAPVGKTVQDLNGWIRSDKNPLFVYIDKIGDIQINVSQQPIPEEFMPDVDTQVEKFAKAYKANSKITIGTTVVYIGSTVKGPQSVIFTKNDLLILIASSDKIENDQWIQYINSLQ